MYLHYHRNHLSCFLFAPPVFIASPIAFLSSNYFFLKTTKVKDFEEEKNEDTLPRLSPSYTFENNDVPSQSENEESSSDVDNKEPAQTSKIVTRNEWMKRLRYTSRSEPRISIIFVIIGDMEE